MAKGRTRQKIKQGLTIRGQLFLVSLTVTSLIILLGFFVIYSVNRIKNINANYAVILSMDDCIKKMTDSESIFLLKEISQSDFYIDENVSSVVAFKGYANKLNKLIDEFSMASRSCKLINEEEIDSLATKAVKFENLFDSLLVLTQNKGFKDYGVVGEMRDIAHDLENSASQLENLGLHVQVLQLRRNEKDYFLRKDPSYFDRFESNVAKFISLVDSSTLELPLKEDLKSKTLDYQNHLKMIMDYDDKIGLTSSTGVLTTLDENRSQITNLNDSFIQAFSTFQIEEIRRAKIRFIVVLGIIIATLTLIIRKIRLNISIPFNHIKNSLQSFSLGIIPKNLSEEKSSQEIREITRVLNQIFLGYQNTIHFANHLKEGKFDKSFKPLSDKDELGNALLDMKDGLLETQMQRDQQQKEEKIQTWINKGTAEIADLLNKNYKNTEEFTYSLVSKLVKYLDANQGGFFVTENDDDGEQYLKLTSAIAYDRRKFVNDRIAIGEGYVGSSVVENNIFYRTEMPEDYITITSGMGGSNPRVLLIAPLVLDNEIHGAIEIASFKELEEHQINFVRTITESITVTMSSFKSKEETQKLLEQTKNQADQIAQAEEEMRQNLEEMQATQEESKRREERLQEELTNANDLINGLKKQLNELNQNKDK